MAATEPDLEQERIGNPVARRRAADQNRGECRRRTFTDSRIRNALRLLEGGEPADHSARGLAMSRTTLRRRIRELPSAVR